MHHDRMAAVNDLIRRFGDKLAGLRRLVIQPFDDYTEPRSHVPSWDPVDAENILDTLTTPKLRDARIPFKLIPGLRQILSQITDLQFGIPRDALKMNFNVVVADLRPHADTIIRLEISDEARVESWNLDSDLEDDVAQPPSIPHGQRHVVQSPRLKQLILQKFPESVLLDAIMAFDCQVISTISIEMGPYRPRTRPGQDRDQRDLLRFSAGFLHKTYPFIACISVKFLTYKEELLFFERFAEPDDNGKWLFPRLTALEFRDMPPHFMKPLLNIATSRLKSSATSSIRSITMGSQSSYPETIIDSYASSLKPYVPDVKLLHSYTY
ncbi:hypothetical protein SCHPADRAFT_633102 [Schizopora paradoxa]|uniref:Uncharacterized protein n=1 Tax=Schizopora paradoxa TaxID=27342 RepID=A0A0H2R7F2_9AGAM|nr:hypothetical protein SCHPADRAFT_633102 [Schizopora paradoxa]